MQSRAASAQNLILRRALRMAYHNIYELGGEQIWRSPMQLVLEAITTIAVSTNHLVLTPKQRLEQVLSRFEAHRDALKAATQTRVEENVVFVDRLLDSLSIAQSAQRWFEVARNSLMHSSGKSQLSDASLVSRSLGRSSFLND